MNITSGFIEEERENNRMSYETGKTKRGFQTMMCAIYRAAFLKGMKK